MKTRHIASSRSLAFATGIAAIALTVLPFIGTASAEAKPPSYAPAYGYRDRDNRRENRAERRAERREDRMERRENRRERRKAKRRARRTTQRVEQSTTRSSYIVGNRRYSWQDGRLRYRTIR